MMGAWHGAVCIYIYMYMYMEAYALLGCQVSLESGFKHLMEIKYACNHISLWSFHFFLKKKKKKARYLVHNIILKTRKFKKLK